MYHGVHVEIRGPLSGVETRLLLLIWCSVHRASWPTTFWSVLLSPPLLWDSKSAGLTDVLTWLALQVGARVPTRVARLVLLPTKPFFQPLVSRRVFWLLLVSLKTSPLTISFESLFLIMCWVLYLSDISESVYMMVKFAFFSVVVGVARDRVSLYSSNIILCLVSHIDSSLLLFSSHLSVFREKLPSLFNLYKELLTFLLFCS